MCAIKVVVVLLSAKVLLGVFPVASANECKLPQELCVPVRFCPHIQDAIESGAVYRNTTLYDYVWSRTCHQTDQEPKVCCDLESTSLGKRCLTATQQPLEGRCVASEHCTPIKRYLEQGRNAAYDRELAENVCYQRESDGKEFYCCPDAYVTDPLKEQAPKKDEDRVLRVKNAFPPCHDPNGAAGLCVPVRHCDHIHAAFLDSRINRDRKLADFVHASRCKSDTASGHSICCAKPTSTVGKGAFVRNRKAAKLGLSQCGRVPFTNRILQGHEAGLGQNPWMAGLLYRKRGQIVALCSGSLVHPRYVLTAAHCMQGETKPIAVRLGEYDTSSNPDCDESGCAAPTRDYGIDRLIPNENFNGRDADYDIALVRLQQEAALSEGEIYPICLPLTDSLLMLKPTKLTVTGWGMTEQQKPSEVLLEADLNLVRRTTFCEGEATCCMRGKHAEAHCRGDSGGPMQTAVPIGKNYRYVLFAVISGGSGVCSVEMKQPGVGVMVGYHLNWILDHMDV